MVIAGMVIVVLAWRRKMSKPESNPAEGAP
jgi:hypothetical protein